MAEISFLQALVENDEHREVFQAGYDLASDPENHASFCGSIEWAGRTKPGIHVKLDDRSENTWTAERKLVRSLDRVLVTEPAFVLGGLCAVYEEHAKAQTVEA